MYQQRNRLDKMRFSDEVKELRALKRKNEFSEQGFLELYDITTLGYGGTKPQNISVLNNQHGGKVHLFNSAPPCIKSRKIHFPKTNFFTESFQPRDYRDIFQNFHRIFKSIRNNYKVRDKRDELLQELLDRIFNKMWAIRAVSCEQFHAKSSVLKSYQKIWLHQDNTDEREKSDVWLDRLVKEISSWIMRAYEKTLGKQAIKFGDAEYDLVNITMKKNKEALR